MAIDSKKSYHVRRFSTGSAVKRYPEADFGTVQGSDLKSILKGYAYDADLDMWFSKNCLIGYSIEVLN